MSRKSSMFPRPATRSFMVRMIQTGGYIPGDPIKLIRPIVDTCIREGWLARETDGALLLTPKGAATFAWASEL